MRKSFLWFAMALSGVAFARTSGADTNQSGRSSSMGAQVTPAHGMHASEPCPPPLTPEQRRLRAEAARRARDARRAAEQARAVELQQARNDASMALAREAATRRALEQEQLRAGRLASVLAERDRADALRRRHRNIVARGGGPLHYRPLFTFGFEGGVAGWAGTEMRDNAYVGGSWGGRVGIDFADWIGIEGRYFGMANPLYAPNAGTGTLLTNGGTGVLRLTVPTRWVQPYGFVGVGAYHTQTWRPADGTNVVASSRDNIAVPLGIGLNFPIGRVVSIAAEGTYHALWDIDHTASPVDQNGIWNGSAVLRFRL